MTDKEALQIIYDLAIENALDEIPFEKEIMECAKKQHDALNIIQKILDKMDMNTVITLFMKRN
jgi:hypothetical protein